MSVGTIKVFTNCLLVASLLCLHPGAFAQSAPPVPPSYTATYSGINQAVDTFVTSLDNRAQGAYSTSLGTGLDSARGGHGFSLLEKNAINGVEEELNRYSQLGIPAVTISIEFPTLCQEFWTQKL